MRVACPRCGGRVSRNYSPKSTKNPLGGWGGLMPAMLFSAFASPECYHCGKIPLSEFSLASHVKLALGSAITIAVAIGLFVCYWVLNMPNGKPGGH